MADEQENVEVHDVDSVLDAYKPQAPTEPAEVEARLSEDEATKPEPLPDEDVPLDTEPQMPEDEAEPTEDGAPPVEDEPEGLEPASEESALVDEQAGSPSGEPAPDVVEDTPVSDASPIDTDDPTDAPMAGEEADGDAWGKEWDFDGAVSPEWTDDEGASEWTDDEPHESVALEKVNTTVRLPAVVDSPTTGGPGEEPQLSDVADTFVLWLHGRLNAAGAFLSQHRLAAALVGLACVAAILVAVLLGLDATKVPPEEQIKSDAQALLTSPTYTVGNYATDDPLVLKSVDITSIRESDEVKGASEVEVLATFSNPVMETRADALLTYQRKGDEWSCIDSSVGNASHHATAGVNQQLVIEHVADLLRKADTRSDAEGLATLYRNAEIEVTNEEFSEEAQTDVVELHCASGGTFVDYECDLTARFRFVPASGAWELAEATVSDGAYDLGFSPLLGTWRGTFSSQQSSSHKCLAARDAGISLTITQANATADGGATIEGTLSGIAHLHADLDADATTTEGDTPLENVPFSGTLHASTDTDDLLELLMEPEPEAAGIVFDCTVQDVTGGTVYLALTLGQANDPDAAIATLTSTYVYRDTFLLVVPYDRQSSFEDSFVLQKEAGLAAEEEVATPSE